MSSAPVLVVSHDASQRDRLQKLLEAAGHPVDTAESAEQALQLGIEHAREVLVADLVMQGMDGMRLLDVCQKAMPKTEVVLVGEAAHAERAAAALKAGAFALLTQPFRGAGELEVTVGRARERGRLLREHERLSEDLSRKNKELDEGVRRVELAYLSAQKAFRLGSDLVGRPEPTEIIEATTLGAAQIAETGRAIFLEIIEQPPRLAPAAWTNVPVPPPAADLGPSEIDEITRDVRRGRLHPRLEPARASLGKGPIFGAPIIVEWKLSGILLALLPNDEDAQARATTSLRQVALAAQQAISVARALKREREVALVDPASGLYNRRYVEQFLKREVARAQRLSLPVSAILMSLEGLGPTRDAVLAEIAALMEPDSGVDDVRFRGSDIAARIGGEEVLVLMPETHRDGAVEKAKRAIRGLTGRRFETAVGPLIAKVGVAEYPRDAKSGEELLATVRTALALAEDPGSVATPPWQDGSSAPTGVAARGFKSP